MEKIITNTFGEIIKNEELTVDEVVYTVKSINNDEYHNYQVFLANDDDVKILTVYYKDIIATVEDAPESDPYADLAITDFRAEVDGTIYESWEDAIEAGKTGKTIKILKDMTTKGIKSQDGYKLVIDFNGHIWNINKTVGSTGTETNGLQLLKGSNNTIMNGTIISETALTLVQNYSNLTIDNMKLISHHPNDWVYVLSVCYGDCIIKNNTIISGVYNKNDKAMGTLLKDNGTYKEGARIWIMDHTVKIRGVWQFNHNSSTTEENMWKYCGIYAPVNYSLEPTPEGTQWGYYKNGFKKLIPSNKFKNERI